MEHDCTSRVGHSLAVSEQEVVSHATGRVRFVVRTAVIGTEMPNTMPPGIHGMNPASVCAARGLVANAAARRVRLVGHLCYHSRPLVKAGRHKSSCAGRVHVLT
jgi:hypothetical protein